MKSFALDIQVKNMGFSSLFFLSSTKMCGKVLKAIPFETQRKEERKKTHDICVRVDSVNIWIICFICFMYLHNHIDI